MQTDLISTAELRGALLEIVATPDDVPTYRQIGDRQRDGRWPTVRVNGKPFTRREDLPVVASALGLPLKVVKPTRERA